MQIKAGDKAPGFILFDTEKKEVDLAGYKGKNVVLLFFPLAFTRTCTKELCAIRDNKKQYEALGATVLAISVDSPATLAKYKAEQKYNFSLLSDFNKEVARSYGALYEDFFGLRGVAKRSAFVIDREGMVRYAEVLENAGQIPDFEKVKETLNSLN